MKRSNDSIIPLTNCLPCVRPSDAPQQATGSASGDADVPAWFLTAGKQRSQGLNQVDPYAKTHVLSLYLVWTYFIFVHFATN